MLILLVGLILAYGSVITGACLFLNVEIDLGDPQDVISAIFIGLMLFLFCVVGFCLVLSCF
jgi:hypothetical protein